MSYAAMPAESSAENALRAPLQDLMTVGAGAWLAGKRARKNGPEVLHSALLAVTKHRAEAAEQGVLMCAPLATAPEGESKRAAASDAMHARCRF